MPATPTTKRKPLYHSDLRGKPVRLTVLAVPKASRWPEGRPYTRVRLAEDGTEHLLEIENEAVLQVLAQLKGRTVTVIASGSRESAALQVLDEDATLAYPTSHPLAPATRVVPEAAAEVTAEPSLARRYFAALQAAATVLEEFERRYGAPPTEHQRAVATTLFLESLRGGHPLRMGTQGEK